MFKKDSVSVFGVVSSKKVFVVRIIVFTHIFLLAALLYAAFTPARYEVSARIEVNKQKQPADIFNDIKSKNLISGVINKLHLAVSYYRPSTFKKTEIYGDSLPLKFVLLSSVKSPAEITVKILNDNKYEINQDDTIEDVAFNKPETYSFGRFTVIKGPGFKVDGKPVVVKFSSVTSLSADYVHKLSVKSVQNNVGYIELSVETTSIAKGTDFLRCLGDALATESKPVILADRDNTDKQNIINGQLLQLEARVAEMKKRQTLLSDGKNQNIASAINKNDQNTLQEQVLQTIKLSAEEPLAQFVQISFSREVKDTKLEALVNNFNQLEMDKQRAFTNGSNSDKIIPVINSQLGKLKVNILQQVGADLESMKNGGVSKNLPSANIAALRDSIINVNMLIQSKQLEYRQCLSQKTTNVKATEQGIGQSNIIRTEKSIIIYPKKTYIFIFAIFIGLILPVILSYLLVYIRLKFFNRV